MGANRRGRRHHRGSRNRRVERRRGKVGPAARRFNIRASGIALAVAGLAFFLRVYRLADQNIWWDEGWTVWLSQHDLAWIALRTASDEHPPLHYWLMHFWDLVAGTEAFAGRFFSVFFGVLMVALLYRIGRKIGGPGPGFGPSSWSRANGAEPRLGVLAALLLALARFQVWWSQDIKNYTLSAFFALASVWFVLLIVERQLDKAALRRPWIGYIVTSALALYSHYLAALIFLANNLFILIVLIREKSGRRELLTRWALAQIAVLALFAPWLALYLQNAATWPAAPAFDFTLFLRVAATVLSLGVTTYIENYAWAVAALTLVAALGAAWLFVGRRSAPTGGRQGALLAVLIVLVPLLLIYLLSLTPAAVFAPKIQARYLLILLPAYSLLLGLGVLFIMRLNLAAGLLALVLVAALQISSLNEYFQVRVLHDDYASLANVVNAFALPGDAVVLNTDQEWPTFLYYLHQPLEFLGVPNGAQVDATTAHRISSLAAQFHAVWVVSIPDALQKDAKKLVEMELANRWPKQYEQNFGDKRLALYAPQVRNVRDVPPENFHPQFVRNDEFDSRLQLVGLDLPVREARPGDIVHAVTYWQSSDLATIQLSLQSRDDYSAVAFQQQSIPVSIGGHERAQADFVIPPDTTARELYVVAQARLASKRLASIRILPRDAAAATGAMTHALNYRLGDAIELLGADVPRREFRAGESVPVTLFWKARQPVTDSYTVFVHLLGAQYNPPQDNFLWGQQDRVPRNGSLPTTAWPLGQTIDDAYAVPIQPNAPSGRYKIEVGMYEVGYGTILRVSDASGKEVGDSLIVDEIEVK